MSDQAALWLYAAVFIIVGGEVAVGLIFTGRLIAKAIEHRNQLGAKMLSDYFAARDKGSGP